MGYDPNTLPQGIDPDLANIYKGADFQPTGSGTGFGDWQYWQGKMSAPGVDKQYFLDRLKNDLAGTGTDNPEGTLGSGPWQKSGQGANVPPPSSSAGSSILSMMNMAPGQTWNPGQAFAPAQMIGAGVSPQQLSYYGSQVVQSPLQAQQSGLLGQLLSRINIGSHGLSFGPGPLLGQSPLNS